MGVVLGKCVSVSVYQARVTLAIASIDSIPNPPLVRCIVSPAGSGDTGEESFRGGVCMQRLWGCRSRSLGGASGPGGIPTGREQQALRVKKASMIRWAWSGRPGRGSSVPCRLLHETPAKVQGMVELAGRVGGQGGLSLQSSRRTLHRWWCLIFFLLAAAPCVVLIVC